MTLYRHILKKAWETTWHNKYLWFFGVFAALLGTGGEYELLLQDNNVNPAENFLVFWQRLVSTGLFSKDTLGGLGELAKNDPLSLAILAAVVLVVLALLVFLIWLAVVSQAALVKKTASYVDGKSGDIRSGLEDGSANFWPVLGMNIVMKIVIYIAFLIISLPFALTIKNSGSLAMIALYVLTFVIFLPAAIIFSFIVKYSIAYVVIAGKKFKEALTAGWELFIKNWLVSIEMAFILFFISVAFGLIWLLLVSILAIPFLLMSYLAIKFLSTFVFGIISTLTFVLLIALVIVSGAALATYQVSAWTALFLQLDRQGGVSKIVRVVSGLITAKK